MKIYNCNKTVLQAARERMALIFDNFYDINVSISSGKDSTVLFYLAYQEAVKRGRKIIAFFLDQEAEYKASIDIIKKVMALPNVIPAWYQVPLYLTNATSSTEFFLYAWGKGEKWIREKDPVAVQAIDVEYPKRFYPFISWYENKNPAAAYLVGIRAEESIMRYRAATKNPGWGGLKWSTIDKKINMFYPIYDWTVYDIWKFIWDYDLPYNKIYDFMFMDNYGIYKKMRVSNLIHEKSFGCLVDLPKFEPDTFNALCKRISGIATAARYASERLIFNNKQLPKHYKSWQEFRDFLLSNVEKETHREKYLRRFENQERNERTYQAQVGQLLINDYENSCSFDTKKGERAVKVREKWMQLL